MWMRLSRMVTAGLVFSIFAGSHVHAENVSDDPTELLQPIMSVSTGRILKPAVATTVVRAVQSTGATGTIVSFPSVGLTAHSRGAQTILQLKNGWRIPMAAMVAPTDYLRAVGGESMADLASPGTVLIGRTAAAIRGAQAGDILELRDSRFQAVSYTIAAIVPDAFVDWGELFITSESAAPLGEMPISRIDITDIRSPRAIIRALRAKNIRVGDEFRVRTSWDRPNPDGTLGAARTKKMFGEFAFRPTVGSSILVSRAWSLKNINWSHTYSDIAVRNSCHKTVVAAMQGALSEVHRAGLSSSIDVRNTNQYGGCFVGRYNRLGGQFGAPSRHAWGMAFDINTTTNGAGKVPSLNCDVVRIFRKWGFAWGGNFWPTDGMHFEYVGKRRDKIGYPSKYCPNNATVPTTTLPPFGSRAGETVPK